MSIFTQHLADENFELVTLFQASSTPVRAVMEPQLTDTLLRARGPLLIHTAELSHNDVVSKRDYFTRFVAASAISSDPTTRPRN